MHDVLQFTKNNDEKRRDRMRDRWAIAIVPLLAGLVSVMAMPAAVAQQEGDEDACCQQGKTASVAPNAQSGKLKSQTVCPIMGGKINKEVFVDVAGYRIYACCPSCLAKIKADPAKAVATLKAKGEKPELRLVVCSKCGGIKGTAECCKPNAKKCPGCGLNKGSIGCCKDLKPPTGKQELTLCPKCGEIKGTAQCCKPNAKKCGVCGLNRGSIGCCKDLKPPAGQKDIVICAGCGEVKGSDKCCKPGAKKCPKCGLNKGAPGCCKDLKPAGQKDIVICPGCGEVKGSDKCCQPGAKKCSKCGLNKGAPGCCKIDRFTKDDG